MEAIVTGTEIHMYQILFSSIINIVKIQIQISNLSH